MRESRATKSIMNAKINLIFYFIALTLSFFSRKIFLDRLGDDFMGLVGTLQNILSFLNLAELGIGTAIGYVLYEPIFERNEQKINEIISIFSYLYRKIGFIILAVGGVVACFLPLIFQKSGFPLEGVFFAYFAFLGSTLIGYFVNYKQTLLSADQKNYVITAYFQSANILKTVLQILVSYRTGNYFLWIAIDLVFAVAYSFILNWKIRQTYPWLSSDIGSGKGLLDNYKEIIKYIRQLFIHRIASFIQHQTSSVLIYAFVSLKTVAFYGNYMIIINKLALLVNNVMDGTGAGVGNLIAEGDKQKIKRVFWELMAFRYFLGGLLVFSLFCLTEPFIKLWVGENYILKKDILILILLNTYISQTRNVNDMFIFGYGLFHDLWAPFTEALLSIAVSIAGGHYLGLAGILAGPVISLILIVGIWKPYFLYRKGFKTPLRFYWFTISKFLLILLISWVASSVVVSRLTAVDPGSGYFAWTKYAAIVVAVFGGIEFSLMYMLDQGMRDFFHRMKSRIFKTKAKRA